jgi:5-methylcytosine-specific restriction endonuclease McrA
MPVDYKNYPLNWKTHIRPAILKRAGDKCEECGLPNYAIIDLPDREVVHENETYALAKFNLNLCWANNNTEKFIIIVLTIAHKDHNPMNSNPENLLALCQACHNRMDVRHRIATRQRNRRKQLAKTAPELPLITDLVTNLTAAK